MNSGSIQQVARAFQQSRVVLAGVELKVFTALGGEPLSAEAVSERTRTDVRAMDRLLCALAAMGLLTKQAGRYANTPSTARYLDENSPDCIRSMGHMASMFQSWATLSDCVRRGSAVRDNAWDREETERFINAMDYRAVETAPQLAEAIDISNVAAMLDVGGGSGSFSRTFCRLNPKLRSTILDLPKVTPLTRKFVAQDNLSDRIEIAEGDYHRDEYGKDYDLVLFSAIMHINSPVENAKLLQKAYNALKPGGRVAVSDFIMNEQRTEPTFGALFSLNMLVNTESGDSYTESEIHQWMEQAGYADITRRNTGPTVSLMLGTRPK